jgi:polysaccharide pyruvyl transferase WcaK-like protein
LEQLVSQPATSHIVVSHRCHRVVFGLVLGKQVIAFIS